MRELIFLLVALSMFGTAYQILSVLLVSLFLSHLLELVNTYEVFTAGLRLT